MNKKIFLENLSTPCGEMVLGASDEKIYLCDWTGGKEKGLRRLKNMTGIETVEGETTSILDNAKREIKEYFEGKRKAFDVVWEAIGTDFQRRVWHELEKVGYGETISYSELAQRLGCPRSVRAVANAVGANPISILIPCHRIIGTDGSLTGYAGGIDVKRFLLALERGGC